MKSVQIADAYREAIVFLGTAAIVVPLVKRFRISPVLGFLLAGILLGPALTHWFGLILPELNGFFSAVTFSNAEHVKRLAEFGVVMLMFMIGLELSFERLSLMRRLVFGLGLSQVVLSAITIATVLDVLGQPLMTSIALGCALSLSSTAIGLPVLADHGRLQSQAGRTAFSILLFQDLAVPLFIVLVTTMGQKVEAGGFDPAILMSAAAAMAVLVALIPFGRLVLRPLFHLVASAHSKELFMAACLLVVMATSVITASVGMSMEIGAFVAGLLLAETEYRRQIEATVEPFKGLLLGLFFMSVGASLDVTLLASNLYAVITATALLLLFKIAVVYALARLFSLTRHSAIEAAMVLSPGGEFAFVLIAIAMNNAIIASESGHMAMVIVTLSMAMLPLLAAMGRRIATRKPAALPAEALVPVPQPDNARIVIVGFGRVGLLIGEMLEVHRLDYIAIDADPRLVSYQRRRNRPVYYGDTSDLELFNRLDLGAARALVLTIDQPKIVEQIVVKARAEWPELTIISRAKDATHAAHLYALGVTDAVPETIEASLQLSEAVLVDIGMPMGLVIASVHEKRDEFRRMLAGEGAIERQRHAIRRSKTDDPAPDTLSRQRQGRDH